METMKVTRGTKTLNNVWKLANLREPPDDCIEEKDASTAYVKSTYTVLIDYHEQNQTRT